MTEDYQEASRGEGEYQPAADSAMAWLREFIITRPKEYLMIKESLASVALRGNRPTDLCMSATHRLVAGEPVSVGSYWGWRGR